MKRIIDLLRTFNELVMFQHTIFSLPFILIAMIVAADGWFGWKLLLLGVLAAITARNFAMALNRYVDRTFDAKNPRTSSRPSVDGRLQPWMVSSFAILNAFAFIFIALSINTLAFWLSFPILIVLGSYSYFKRFSALAHLVLGISLGLAPIAGVVAVSEQITIWSVLLSFGVMFWVAGFDLLYSLQDIEFDKKTGLHSIPSRYGADATMFIAQIFHFNTVIFWLLFSWSANLGFFGFLATIVGAFMLYYEHHLVTKDTNEINRAFFTVNGYLGVAFLIFIIIDKVL